MRPRTTADLVRSVLADIAPDELATFDLAERRYLQVAARTLSGAGDRRTTRATCADDAMGIGVEIEVASVLTGAVAYVCTALAQAVVAGTADSVRESVAGGTRRTLRGLRRRSREIPEQQWTEGELQAIHAAALSKSVEYGVDDIDAERIADAIIDSLSRGE